MKIGKVVVQIEANRPWRDGKRAGPKRREPHAPPSAGKQAEIEKCLACSRPDCQGSCPPGRKRLPVPEDFAERVQGLRGRLRDRVPVAERGRLGCQNRREGGNPIRSKAFARKQRAIREACRLNRKTYIVLNVPLAPSRK